MEPKIFVNGKEISNLGDLPPGVKDILEDKNNNGLPDIAENPFAALGKLGQLKDLSKNLGPFAQMIKDLSATKGANISQQININGQTYNNWEEVPDDLKQKVKEKMQTLKHGEAHKVTQMLSNMPTTTNTGTKTKGTSEIPITSSPASQEKQDATRRKIFIIGVIALVGWLLYQYVLT
jgi:hypothetical protein